MSLESAGLSVRQPRRIYPATCMMALTRQQVGITATNSIQASLENCLGGLGHNSDAVG
jgi:hypothetical protein